MRTKIVCTLGPAVDSKEKVRELVLAGMSAARLNFSHGSYEEHATRIQHVKEVRDELRLPIGIILDTRGPEMRLGKLKNDAVMLEQGAHLWLCKDEVIGDAEHVSLIPSDTVDALCEGMFVLFDDGYIVTRVVAVEESRVRLIVEHGGVIRSSKGVNVPGIDLVLPAMTDIDIEDIKFGCQCDVDYIAASFIRTAEDVITIKKLLESEGKGEIQVISKIENQEGVKNFDAVLQVSDGLMIARGDLGVELPLNEVPKLQKMMIQKGYWAAKPAVTATQMLESMIENPRPTRAEASDVANAIYDSTSAVMLSGETAMGKYPVRVVEVMRSIIETTEEDFHYREFFQRTTSWKFPNVASSVAIACINTAYSANAKAIFAFTTSGVTARLISRFRPEQPILAMTSSQKVYHQLALVWGVVPIYCERVSTIEEAYQEMSSFALEKGYVQQGDLVVITAGTPFGQAGTTNMLIVDSIGGILDSRSKE